MSVQLPFVAQPLLDEKTGRINAAWYLALLNLSNTVTGALVSSVNLAGNNGITVAGSPITSAGVITLGIGNLTCATAVIAGTVTAANVIATGSISAANIAASGTINTANEIATGTVTAANVVVTGAMQAVTMSVSNAAVASTVTAARAIITSTITSSAVVATASVTAVSIIATGTLTTANGVITGTAFQSATAGGADLGVASTGWKRLYIDYTNTATVGNVTINKAAGRVNMSAGLGLVSVTNNLVTPNSHIFLNADSAPGNLVAVQFFAISVTGAFVINAVPAVTNQTAIDFLVINAD